MYRVSIRLTIHPVRVRRTIYRYCNHSLCSNSGYIICGRTEGSKEKIDLVLFCRLCKDSSSDYRYSQFVLFIVKIDVSNNSVNAQQTNYIRKSISSVRSSEIKAMIQLKLNMLVLIPSFAILDWQHAVTGHETYDHIMSLQNTRNRVHLIVRWVNIPSYRRRVHSIILQNG